MHCPRCGTYNDDDSIYCSKCGQNLRESVNNNYNNGNSGKKPFSLGKLIAVVLVLFILVAMAGVCVNYANKRGDVADKVEEINGLGEQIEYKFGNLNLDFDNLQNANSDYLKNELYDIKSDIKESESIIESIDRSVLADDEEDDINVASFDNDMAIDLVDSFIRNLPDFMNNLKEADSAADSNNRYGTKIALSKAKNNVQNMINDIDIIEMKVSNQKIFRCSGAMNKYCSETLITLRSFKSTFENVIDQIDNLLSKL